MNLAQELDGVEAFDEPAPDEKEESDEEPEYSDLEELSFSDGSELGFTMAAEIEEEDVDQPLTKLVLFDDEPLAKYLQNVQAHSENVSYEKYEAPEPEVEEESPSLPKKPSFDFLSYVFPFLYPCIPAPKAALHELCFEYSYKEYGGLPSDLQIFEYSSNLNTTIVWTSLFAFVGMLNFYYQSRIFFTLLILISINLIIFLHRLWDFIQWQKAWNSALALDGKILQFQALAQRALKKIKHMELVARGFGVSRANDLPINRIEKNDGISHVNELRRKLLESLRLYCGEFSKASFILRGIKHSPEIRVDDVDFVPFLSELDKLLKISFVRKRVFWSQTCKYLEASFHQFFPWQRTSTTLYDNIAQKIDDMNLELFAHLNILRKKRKRKAKEAPIREPKSKREYFLRILRYLQERSDELTAGVQLVHQHFQAETTNLELCYHCFERIGSSIQRATADWNNGQAYLYRIDKNLRKTAEAVNVKTLEENQLEDGENPNDIQEQQPVHVPNLNPEDMTEEMFELIAKRLEDSDEESDHIHRNMIPPIRINSQGLMQELRSVMGPKWKSKQVPDYVDEVEEESDSLDEETRRKIEEFHSRQTMNLAAMFQSMNTDLVRGNIQEFS